MSAVAATRQSPMHDQIAHLTPRLVQVQGMSAAVEIGEAKQGQWRRLGLCDASALPRMGVKGPAAPQWLGKQGVSVPDHIYGHSALDGTDGLVIRTGSTEFFLEDSATGTRVARLWDAAANQPGVYRFFRQDASIILSGELAFDVLAQTCGYDFRYAESDFVMTRVAVVSASILRQDHDGVPVFRIWCDPSFGPYLWEQLLEIAREVGGDSVGLSCFFQLSQK